MDFSFSDEQNMLQDSVQRFIQNNYNFESRQKIVASDDGFSRAHWQQFAEMGWLGYLSRKKMVVLVVQQ